MLKKIPFTLLSFTFPSSCYSIFLFPLEKCSWKRILYLDQVFQSDFHSCCSSKTALVKVSDDCHIAKFRGRFSVILLHLSSIWTDYFTLPQVLSSLGFWNTTLSWFSFQPRWLLHSLFCWIFFIFSDFYILMSPRAQFLDFFSSLSLFNS